MKYGNQNYLVEKIVITFFTLWGVATLINFANASPHKNHSLDRQTKIVAITILAAVSYTHLTLPTNREV